MQHTQEQDRASDIKRVNRGYKLREDLIIACKHIALDQGRKLYEVMEEAIEEYLQHHASSQKER